MRLISVLQLFFFLYVPTYAIGNETLFVFKIPPPWKSDGRQNSDHISYTVSKPWFDIHKPRTETIRKLGRYLGHVPVQSTRAEPQPTGLKSVRTRICSFLIEDLRPTVHSGNVRHRMGSMLCPEDWECKTEERPSLRIPDNRGVIGDNPRRIAVCQNPNDLTTQQIVVAHSGDCVDSKPIVGSSQYVAARITKKRRRDDQIDLPSKKTHLRNGLQMQRTEDMRTILSINDKQDSGVVHSKVDDYQISMNAQAGHIYKACVDNGFDEDLTLRIFTGLIQN